MAQSAGVVEYTDCFSVDGKYTKPSDGEALVQELWEIGSTPSFSLLLGHFLSGMVIHVNVLSRGQIELLHHLTVCPVGWGCRIH